MTATQIFYQNIAQIRDLFHKYGRFDDANAKLDELSKYLCIYVYEKQSPKLAKYNIASLLIEFEKNNSFSLVSKIQELFHQVILIDELKDANGHSIFKNSAKLNIAADDHQFAYALLKLVCNAVDGIIEGERNFDVLNECFGHFVRANFRNHIEDAQYMTPNEVVEFICDIALHDINVTDVDLKEFIVLDPCCGVGSFISTFYQKNLTSKKVKNLTVIGQDKVERMARLSKINLFLANNKKHIISNNNSLSGKSALDNLHGKVDLILTNPPFGAKFTSDELKVDAKKNYPHLFDIIVRKNKTFNSEVLFVDKCLSLLKPNGKLLAVVPDSVISSKGLNEMLRRRLAYKNNIHIKAIIELPNVTFAQAGTRTKTSILYIEKGTSKISNTFIAKSESIGFEVSTKKGATIKHEQGENDLLSIFKAYVSQMDFKNGLDIQKVIQKQPSCVAIPSEWLKEQTWTPNHYKASKFTSFDNMKIPAKEVNFVKLSDIAFFDTKKRKKEILANDAKCISVLHINDENLNYEDFLNYAPKYMGIPCQNGDLLFSKINPRIVRIFVIPNLPYALSCSSEFEVLNSSTELSNYALKMLLLLPAVQIQIKASTSGTSSSHNRIKTNELSNLIIPMPKKGSNYYTSFIEKAKKYEEDSIAYNNLIFTMYKTKMEVFDMVE
ncbi:MAG: HsdM family class I SAM-dependent methyltransferase [Chitinophagales bacterium]